MLPRSPSITTGIAHCPSHSTRRRPVRPYLAHETGTTTAEVRAAGGGGDHRRGRAGRGGCTEATGRPRPPPPSPPPAPARTTARPRAGTRPRRARRWRRSRPFSEPLNVVISARSTVSLGAIQAAMGKWDTVSTATTVTPSGIHLKCISSEQADVTGAGYVPQHVAWRLGGCVDGQRAVADRRRGPRQDLEPAVQGQQGRRLVHRRQLRDPVPGPERHARARPAPAAPTSRTRPCTRATPTTASTAAPAASTPSTPTATRTAPPPSSPPSPPAAKAKGWHYSQRTVTVTRDANAGEGGVPFNGDVYVLTVTA